MKHAFLFLGIAGALSLRASAADVLDTQHVDLSVNYRADQNAWQLTLRDEDIRREYAGRTEPGADRVIVRGALSGRVEVPNDSRYAFLGTPGASIWVLPQTQDSELPFLGISTENKTTQLDWTGEGVAPELRVRGIAGGIFAENRITLTLSAFNGSGDFFLYQTDNFGNPLVAMNTADGLSAADNRSFVPAVHAHFNWAFTAPGDYHLTFIASGTLNAGSVFTQSDPTTFRFSIAPEPGSAVLALLGAGLLVGRPRRIPSIHHTP